MSNTKKKDSKQPQEQMSFARQVWTTLSAINVNDLTEKKGQLTYLSWANAWATLMEHYPESRYKRGESEYFQDGTMSVSMSVIIQQGDNKLKREMYLQVLNYKNQPVQEPDAHLINNTRMRCLAKAIAMCGLGCYLYTGHDLPTSEPVEVQVKQPRIPHPEMLNNALKAMNNAKSLDMLAIQFESNRDYFKEWSATEQLEVLIKHKDLLKAALIHDSEKEAA